MAKYKTFRVYTGGGEDLSDRNYMFSIIAGPDEVEYIIPVDTMSTFKGIDNDRIKLILEGLPEEEIPTTPEGWAILAVENMSSNVAVMPFMDESDNWNLLYAEEEEFANKVGEWQERERLGLNE